MASIIPLLTEFEKDHISERQALPEKYLGLSDAEMDARIAAARQKLGSRLLILGHHYQRDEVIKFADYHRRLVPPRPPDRDAPERGLHRVLRRPLHGRERRRPGRPAPAGHPAGPRGRLLDGRHGRARPARELLGGADEMGVRSVVPVTYINSAASIKAFVGERGGTVCTSSNAAAHAEMGVRARRERSSSCPTSISGATPPTRWASRSTRWSCGIRTRSTAASIPTRWRRRR